MMKVKDKVKLTDKVLKRTQGKAETLNLVDEPGDIVKVDKDHVYVKTQHGTHYVHESKVAKDV